MGEEGEVRRIKLTAAYDGTDFCGWQIQNKDRSVQQVIEEALARLHKHPVRVVGAGRTDSGVHALGQTLHFDTDRASIPAEKFVPALNSLLPPDVRIRNGIEAGHAFHARRDAHSREYRYHLSVIDEHSPFSKPYTLSVRSLPDVRLLQQYASQLVGVHDFTTFSAAGDVSPTKIRHIIAASWYPAGSQLVFRVVGNAFLWKMVRSLTGTMLDLAERGAPRRAFEEILESRDRGSAGTTASAKGLFLYKVNYEE